MIRWGRVAAFLVGISFALVPLSAVAQVPAHVPGTICITPKFWCWAQPAGPPRMPCFCNGPNGPVQGVLG